MDKDSLLGKLNKMLPDYNIFDSGGSEQDIWITLIPPYNPIEMEWLLPVVKKAVQAYINIGSKLAEDYKKGTIADNWDIFEHGGQRRFENPVTGQVIETPKNDILNRENLDPHFLINFMKTTSGFNKTLKKKKIDFHKMVKLLDIIDHHRNKDH